jgi:hypothetical protein
MTLSNKKIKNFRHEVISQKELKNLHNKNSITVEKYISKKDILWKKKFLTLFLLFQ